jgi:hypothetical protein
MTKDGFDDSELIDYFNMINMQCFYLIYFICSIIMYNSARIKNNLHRSALLAPNRTSWSRVYTHADNESFLLVTGMGRLSFNRLKRYIFQGEAYHGIGRPKLLDEVGQLGLILLYLNSSMRINDLCLLFGITPSTASRIIRNMLPKVIRTLTALPSAKVKFPNAIKMAYYARLVQGRKPEVDNVIGFVDGLSLRVQCSDSEIDQDDIITDTIMILAAIMFSPLHLMVKLFMLVLISQDPFMIHKYLQSYNQSSLKRLDNMLYVLIKDFQDQDLYLVNSLDQLMKRQDPN